MSDEPKRISEIQRSAESFSGLQYVATKTGIQWPWSSPGATNQVVDLVRAIPWLLDQLAAERAARQAADEELAETIEDRALSFRQADVAHERYLATLATIEQRDQQIAALRDGLVSIERILGPASCRCDGLQVEVDMALEIARALLATPAAEQEAE